MANFSESDIREAFQTFDRDGNGFIGASDIHNTYLAMNENLNDDEVILRCFRSLSLSSCALNS
jgi:Ca2+-binding EF-hand superfamily protein